jgi:hypothetical protein
MERHPGRLAAVALLVLPFAVLGHALLPGKVMSPADNVLRVPPWSGVNPGVSPKNPLLADITFLFHPSTMYGATEIRAGRFPLWNPHTFGGVPFFANPQTALLFPLTALAYVLPYSTALTLMSLLKLSTAGLGMYWFLRRLSVERFPALLAGMTFSFSALLVTWLQWSYASAVSLLPLLFATTELVRERRDGRSVAALSVVVALAVFAGYPQRLPFWLALLGLWVLYRARDMPRRGAFLAGAAGGVTLGIVLAAVQLLPFIEYARSSAVLAYRTDWMIYFPLPFRAVIAILMPYFFGSTTGHDFWGPANFNEISLSVGIVPWLALPVTVVAAWSRTGTKYFVALLALSAAVVYGVPVAGSALASLPLLATTIAVRNADVLVFAMTVLTGLGLDAIIKIDAPTRRLASVGVRIAFTALALLALGFVTSYYALASINPTAVPLWAQFLWLVLTATVATLLILRLLHDGGTTRWPWLALGSMQLASLLPVAVASNPVVDARLLDYSPPPVVKHLQARTALEPGRVMFGAGGATNLGLIFRLFEFGGNDGMTPRHVEQLADPVGSLDSYASSPFRVTVDVASPVFDLLGIHYVALPPRSLPPAPHFALDYDGPDAVVYRNGRTLPRAFLVFRTRTCLDDAAALDLIHGGGIDFRQEAIIAGCGDGVPSLATPGGPSSAKLMVDAADRVLIETTADTAAYLVLTDAWVPGWRAWVDGTEHTVWRANHALRAVSLPPGRHRVEFRYAPASVRWGLLATMLGALLLAGLCWTPRRGLVAGAALVLILGGNPRAADATLPIAPFRVETTPAVLTEGEDLTVRLDRVDATPSNAAGPYAVYISIAADSRPRSGWLFLTQAGGVSATPVPYRRDGAAVDRVTLPLRGLGPADWYVVRIQFVKASADQPTRKQYVYQPLWANVRVEARTTPPHHSTVLGLLSVGTLAAVLLTWLAPRRWGGTRAESD